jgi:hypothetical protein
MGLADWGLKGVFPGRVRRIPAGEVRRRREYDRRIPDDEPRARKSVMPMPGQKF